MRKDKADLIWNLLNYNNNNDNRQNKKDTMWGVHKSNGLPKTS